MHPLHHHSRSQLASFDPPKPGNGSKPFLQMVSFLWFWPLGIRSFLSSERSNQADQRNHRERQKGKCPFCLNSLSPILVPTGMEKLERNLIPLKRKLLQGILSNLERDQFDLVKKFSHGDFLFLCSSLFPYFRQTGKRFGIDKFKS